MSTSTQGVRLSKDDMIELLERHMRCELEADLAGLMDTLADNPVWGRDDDPNRLVGRDAINAHYSGILEPGRYDAKRVRGWYDEEAQSSASEYLVTVNYAPGESVTFPVIACVDFEDGRMKNELLYFPEGRAPSNLLPESFLMEQAESFAEAQAKSLSDSD